ncbi:hypothetical protein HY745_03220 [Candidatus Desantisbacteria bacterium]|nr:hypothetical protein [Candidatus Desantisbacteria bacterium]
MLCNKNINFFLNLILSCIILISLISCTKPGTKPLREDPGKKTEKDLEEKKKQLRDAEKVELLSKIKELEYATKQANAEAEEIAGQVNIYAAKQRVGVIGNNTAEAEKFKALEEEAKIKGDEVALKAEKLKKEYSETKSKLKDRSVSDEELSKI